ncbi:MAG: AAA family ATPase [Mariprofundus sp.]|nr:AAA family ATPase [Mariprofundus sp.]
MNLYLDYFGLKEPPFSIAPNPRYLYMTHQHQDALAHLRYGLQGEGGILLLTGEVGTGKTTISRRLLETTGELYHFAWIINPRLSITELLATICDEFKLSYVPECNSIKHFTDLISAFLIQLHSQAQNAVLIIDEAQNLSPDVLEQLRLLTNLETNERKLLQIILLGQPELRVILAKTELRQLAQRITVRYHLTPLNLNETGEYIRYRLSIAGCPLPLFNAAIIKTIHQRSQGTPRLINLLCDRILLGMYSQATQIAQPKHVQQAALELFGEQAKKSYLTLSAMLAVTIFSLISALFFYINQHPASIPSEFENVKITDNKQLQISTPALTINSTAEPIQAPATSTHKAASIQTVPASPEPRPLQTDIIANPLPPTQQILESKQSEQADTSILSRSAQPVSRLPWLSIEKTGDKISAFQTLLNIWAVDLNIHSKRDPCSQIEEKNIFCLQLRAQTWMLEAFNGPAIFQTIDTTGKNHFAVIRLMDGENITLQLNKEQWTIKRHELLQHWHGDITLFWNHPPGYQKSLHPGDSGLTVQWLSKQLDQIQGTIIPPRQRWIMDEVMVERLKTFQRAQEIYPDGIAGPMTLMRIQQLTGATSPPQLMMPKGIAD